MPRKRKPHKDTPVLCRTMYEHYLQAPNLCPVCHEDSLKSTDRNADDNWIDVEVLCESCGVEFTETYYLQDVEGFQIVPDDEQIALDIYDIVITHDGQGDGKVYTNLLPDDWDDASVERDPAEQRLYERIDDVMQMLWTASRNGSNVQTEAWEAAVATMIEHITMEK